ncbi:MAG: glycerate 2-kinase [Acidobacteriaceae bacterium]|nr:glycerate 2-kinase [Acidobacteriaceae bacterium]
MEALPQQNNGAEDRSHRILSAPYVAAKDIFLHALDATRVAVAMERHMVLDADMMVIDGHRYDLPQYERLLLVAIGKAAVPMASSFLSQVGEAARRFEGIVVGAKAGPLPEGIQFIQGGHPSPTEASLEAAAAILQLLESATARDLVVFLISGGGSSMVEQMLDRDITLAEIAATHKALVESGAPITAINTVRKHLSAVKGGRLAAAAAPAEQISLFVSDVPAGELDALASGPTLPDRSTLADARRILSQFNLAANMPERVVPLLLADDAPESPKPGDAAFARSHQAVLADSISLEQAAASRATELGWQVTLDSSCDDWTAEAAAAYLLKRLEDLKQANPRARVCLLSAGEVTVRVPSESQGHGGRNQHFALLCAREMAGSDRVVLSAGSDGIDGNSPAAGAIVDGATASRADTAGYPVAKALRDFDSHGLLALLGDTISTGPTGNNLRDLRILLAP